MSRRARRSYSRGRFRYLSFTLARTWFIVGWCGRIQATARLIVLTLRARADGTNGMLVPDEPAGRPLSYLRNFAIVPCPKNHTMARQPPTQISRRSGLPKTERCSKFIITVVTHLPLLIYGLTTYTAAGEDWRNVQSRGSGLGIASNGRLGVALTLSHGLY